MKSFYKFRIAGLVAVFLVFLAGSIVRMTGSGMGCPDWPKCFGEWVPPTSEAQLPDDYREQYSEQRAQKIQKFANFLAAIGFDEQAHRLENDSSLLNEQPYNVAHTYTEYGNRLVGFLAGNFILIGTIWSLFFYRRHRSIFWLSLISLIVIGIQGWFGSIVVATNLVPWTISVHMILALIIVGLEVFIISKCMKNTTAYQLSKKLRILLLIALVIILYQIIMGVQVRQQVDQMIDSGLAKGELMLGFDIGYYIHRSFSWAVLFIFAYVYYQLRQIKPYNKYLIVILIAVGIEFITGILLSYFDFPLGTQPFHLGAATLIFALELRMLFITKLGKNTPRTA